MSIKVTIFLSFKIKLTFETVYVFQFFLIYFVINASIQTYECTY